MHLLISFLLVAAGNAQRNKIYVNEGVQNVEIPCQIPKNVLYNPESKVFVMTRIGSNEILD